MIFFRMRSFFFEKESDGVAVALAHFLAVQSGDRGGFLADAGFGQLELWSQGFVELLTMITGDFDRTCF